MGEIEAAESESAQAAMPLVGMLLTPAIARFMTTSPTVELNLDSPTGSATMDPDSGGP